jgi:phage shock protein PspC (stress-responsive transcriptional regulator)
LKGGIQLDRVRARSYNDRASPGRTDEGLTMPQKLHRSQKDRLFLGVCGGLAEYFMMDSTLMRVICVLIMLATGGAGIVAYFVLAILMPREGQPAGPASGEVIRKNVEELRHTARDIADGLKDGLKPAPRPSLRREPFIAGIVLIVLGIVFLLATFGVWNWLSWGRLWPLFLVLIGVLIIVAMFRRRK